MKAITILRALLKESISTENCGIVRVHEEMPYTEFIRQYLFYDFQDRILDYHRFVASEGEYFYCWNSTEIDFSMCHARFGSGFSHRWAVPAHHADGRRRKRGGLTASLSLVFLILFIFRFVFSALQFSFEPLKNVKPRLLHLL